MTPEEYLEIERKAEFRSEYWQGEMYAMSGASRTHNLINANLAHELFDHLKSRSCEAYFTDMRVEVGSAELYTYPDAVVVCGTPRFNNNRDDTLLNPALIIEILSPSTEEYDRSDKFQLYQSVQSLQEYVLISTEQIRVERFTRQPADQWLLATANSLGQKIRLESIDFELSLANLYERVQISNPRPRIRGLHR